MRPGPAIAVLMLIAAFPLPGCGDGETSAAGAEQSARSTQATIPASTTAKCHRGLDNFLDAMESLNNLVTVGVDYDSYLSAVNHVRSTYAPIQPKQLPLPCLIQVAVPAEQGLNTYIEAVNTWGDCLAATSCDLESIEARVRRRWSRASRLLAASRNGP